MRAFAAGAMCSATVAAVLGWVVLASGSAGTVVGDTAEQWTAAELRGCVGASGG